MLQIGPLTAKSNLNEAKFQKFIWKMQSTKNVEWYMCYSKKTEKTL